MESCKWVRGEEIGRGSFGSVSKATVLARNDAAFCSIPSLMAVKSCNDFLSNSLKEEKRIFDRLGLSPHIVRCFGDSYSVENGESLYNIFLELASEGSLGDEIKKRQGVGLAESEVRRLTRSLLEGLSTIHERGFVHCDIKPQNILLFHDGEAKISDFGLSKEKDAKTSKSCLRGTPLYIAPESVKANEYEAPCDVWALGCVVSEMATGNTAWDLSSVTCLLTLLKRIVGEKEIPNIPDKFSEEGRDFLSKCFVKNPRERWTAQKLLTHPFVDDGQISSALPSSTDHLSKKLVIHDETLSWSLSQGFIPVS